MRLPGTGKLPIPGNSDRRRTTTQLRHQQWSVRRGRHLRYWLNYHYVHVDERFITEQDAHNRLDLGNVKGQYHLPNG